MASPSPVPHATDTAEIGRTGVRVNEYRSATLGELLQRGSLGLGERRAGAAGDVQ